MLACPALAADGPIDTLAGVYKTQFKNGNIDGGKYDSEDILEIVKVSPTAAYVRTHLEFFNGHVCNIQGVADVEDGALVYRAREKNVQGKPVRPQRAAGPRPGHARRQGRRIAPSAPAAIAACTTARRST